MTRLIEQRRDAKLADVLRTLADFPKAGPSPAHPLQVRFRPLIGSSPFANLRLCAHLWRQASLTPGIRQGFS